MSNESPFARLKDLKLHDKKAKTPSPAECGKPNSKKPHKSSGCGADPDTRLFLQAVNVSCPHPKEGGGPSSTVVEDDSTFLQSMQAAGVIQPARDRKKTANAAKAAKKNADNVRKEAALSLEAKDPASAAETTAATAPPKEEDVFLQAMADVTPVQKRGRDLAQPAVPRPAAPSGKSPGQIMQEILDGRIEFALQHTGEYVEGHVTGVDPAVLDQLRSGHLSPEAHIDLHGMTAAQAREALVEFIKNAYQRNMRTLTVVTGRGNNSPDGVGVLRNLMQSWLTRDPLKRVVLAFCSAKTCDGGSGALYVLLRKYKKSKGKIIWEMPKPETGDDF